MALFKMRDEAGVDDKEVEIDGRRPREEALAVMEAARRRETGREFGKERQGACQLGQPFRMV